MSRDQAEQLLDQYLASRDRARALHKAAEAIAELPNAEVVFGPTRDLAVTETRRWLELKEELITAMCGER